MSIRNALASVPVRDIDASIVWYERLFGRPADSRPMEVVAEWKFDGGGWLQVYELPERAGHGSVTLSVHDIEEQSRQLQHVGVTAGERNNTPRVKTLMVTDPDGNHIAFAESLDPRMAH